LAVLLDKRAKSDFPFHVFLQTAGMLSVMAAFFCIPHSEIDDVSLILLYLLA
jgi:hypothetical protein